MVIPIYDNDPLEKSHRAYVTFALIALNVAIFLLQDSASDKTSTLLLVNFALFPVAVTGDAVTGGFMPPSLTLVTYMFLHGGWMHLIFNMLFLWVFGDNIEDALGRGRFLVFYLVCGIAGGGAHVLASPGSNVPLVGASGAIAGIVAALSDAAPVRKDHRAHLRLRADQARILLGARLLGADAGLARIQPGEERYRLVGACRRACGRGAADHGPAPGRRRTVRVHAPGRRHRGGRNAVCRALGRAALSRHVALR